jgi:ABC-type uncharacterized transport system involved in gliding motility auxiliary subunit
MNKKPSRFAPVGLVISAIAFLAIVGILLIRGFEATGLYTPADPVLLDRILYAGIAVFVAGFAVYAILDPDRVRKLLTGRQVQYGSNSLIMFAAFLGILVVVNMLANQFPKRWDVTEDKQHTLAPETVDALAALPEPVQATAFFSARLRADTARQLLEDYKISSTGKFDYRFMDPDSNPVLVKQLGITGDGKILLQMGENQEIVTYASEQELTGGLVRLLNPDRPVVYFLTGNGEHDLDTPNEAAYTNVRQILESKNYDVETLNLQAEVSIPDNTRVLVIGGPLVPLSTGSVTAIQNFLENGGKALILEDPIPLTDFGEKSDPLAEYLSSEWGITLMNDIVVDTNSPSTPFFAVGAQYTNHPITEKMQGVAAIFPYARSLAVDSEASGVTATPLILTIPSSWGETDFQALEQQNLSYDEGLDYPGPATLGVAAENFDSGSRIVVFGNSSFPQDSNFDFSGNGDLMVNSIDWLIEREDLIGITTKNSTERSFNTPGSLEFILLVASSVCLIPLIIIAAGIYAWVMRRRRG